MAAVRVERDGPVLRVTLARPEKRNALDAGLITELAEAFRDIGDARAVLLAGEGPSFSAGADLAWMRDSVSLPYAANVEDALAMRRMLLSIDACLAPVVARVHGHALGGAVGLIACADVAIASPDTVFGLTEVRVGIIPATISPFVLARIGAAAARRYFLTGERFDATEAHRIGLVHMVAADLDACIDSVLASLLAGGPEAVREAKRLVVDAPLGDESAERIAAQRVSDEGQEGLRAFLERREPAFRAAWPPA